MGFYERTARALKALNARNYEGGDWESFAMMMDGERTDQLSGASNGRYFLPWDAVVAVAEFLQREAPIAPPAVLEKREKEARWHEAEAAAWRRGDRDATSDEVARIKGEQPADPAAVQAFATALAAGLGASLGVERMRKEAAETPDPSAPPLMFWYRDVQGDVARRRVIPYGVRYEPARDGMDAGWRLDGYDLDRKENWTFRLRQVFPTRLALAAGMIEPEVATSTSPWIFRYRNHRGEVAVRWAIPRRMFFGTTEHHPDPQWLVEAYDVHKQADRTFALANVLTETSPAAGVGMWKTEAMARFFSGFLQTRFDCPDDDNAIMTTDRHDKEPVYIRMGDIRNFVWEQDRFRTLAREAAPSKSSHVVDPDETPDPDPIIIDPDARERLGRVVRKAWVAWAREQSLPKPSWLVPYEELSERDKEADRRIGEAVARAVLRNVQPSPFTRILHTRKVQKDSPNGIQLGVLAGFQAMLMDVIKDAGDDDTVRFQRDCYGTEHVYNVPMIRIVLEAIDKLRECSST